MMKDNGMDTNLEKIYSAVEYAFSNALATVPAIEAFSAFAGKHMQFSLKNILMFYVQNPHAEYIAAKGTLEYLSSQGIFLKDDPQPLLCLHPQLDGMKLGYRTAYMYSFVFEESDTAKIVDLSSKGEHACLKQAIEEISGYAICEDPAVAAPEPGEDGTSYKIPGAGNTAAKVDNLISFYAKYVAVSGLDGTIKNIEENLIKYLYYKRFVPDNKSVVPSVIALSGVGEKKDIFKNAFMQVKHLTDRMEKPRLVLRKYEGESKTQTMEEER